MYSLESDKDIGEIGKILAIGSFSDTLHLQVGFAEFLLSRYRCELCLFLLYKEGKALTEITVSVPLQISFVPEDYCFLGRTLTVSP